MAFFRPLLSEGYRGLHRLSQASICSTLRVAPLVCFRKTFGAPTPLQHLPRLPGASFLYVPQPVLLPVLPASRPGHSPTRSARPARRAPHRGWPLTTSPPLVTASQIPLSLDKVIGRRILPSTEILPGFLQGIPVFWENPRHRKRLKVQT